MSTGALVALLLTVAGCSDETTASSEPGPSVSAEDIRAYELSLKSFADSAGLAEIPDVSVVRWVSIDEAPSTRASCLQEEGIDVTLESDGSISADLPADQDTAYDLAQYICLAKYPLDPKYSKPLDDEQLKRVYEFDVNVLVPCLSEQGYASEVPSWAVFRATWQAGQPWNPANDLMVNLGPEVFVAVSNECVLDPPNDYIYGDGSE